MYKTVKTGVFSLLYLLPIMLSAQLFETDFESQLVKTSYTRPVWTNDGFIPNNWDNALEARTQTDTTYHVSGEQSLQVEYPQGQYGNSLANGTGTQVELLLEPEDEYYMSYFLRFSENFSWGTTSEGGKLPGLTNRNRCGSDFICDGTDGFSARFMWRKNGKGVLYLYHMDMPKQYGQDFAFQNLDGSDFLFEKGKWYHIAERVKINTGPNNFDGIVTVWINGQEVLYLDTIRFQSNGDKIDNFFFSTFHGGSSNTWAPTETCYTWFDDLKIGNNFNDVKYQSCSNPDAEYFGETCIITSSDKTTISTKGLIRNPVNNIVKLNTKVDDIKLYNLQGLNIASSKDTQTIDIHNIPDGIYLIQIKKGIHISQQKIIKNSIYGNN